MNLRRDRLGSHHGVMIQCIVLCWGLLALIGGCAASAAQVDAEPDIGAAIELSGVAQTVVTASSVGGFAVDSFSLSAVASLGKFSSQLNAIFSQTSDDTVSISSTGVLGNMRLNSSLELSVASPYFKSFQGGVAFTLAGIEFVDIISVGTPQTASYTQLSWTAGGDVISAQGTVKLGLCPVGFDSTNVCITYDWPECNTSVTSCVTSTAENGFGAATFSISDYVLVEDFWGVRAALDAVLSFALEQKTFAPTLRLEPNWFICPEIQLLSEFSTAGTPITVSSFAFYGIAGECRFDNGVTFSFADSLVDEKNGSVTGNALYFERFGISGPLPSCCGTTGIFEINAFFERPPAPSGTLFGMGLITASFELRLFTNFSFAFDGSFTLASSDWEMAWTFNVLW